MTGPSSKRGCAPFDATQSQAYLDTHAAIWLAQGDLYRFQPAGIALVERATLRISPMAVLELQYLFEIKRILLRPEDLLLKLTHELSLEVCSLPFFEITRLALSESWTRDPFDRMIVAHARAAGLAPLLSADQEIAAHYARTVW